MFSKLILFLIVFQFAFEQNNQKLNIKAIKEPSCSTGVGKIDFKIEINYSKSPDKNSYFLLNLKDSDGKKIPSICKVGSIVPTSDLSPDKENPTENPSPGPNPDENPSPGPNPDENPSPGQNPNETVPIQPIPMDDLKKLMDKLRENLQDKLNDTVIDIIELDEVNGDLKDILNFNIMKLIKKVNEDLNDLEITLLNIQDEKVIKPLNVKLTELINKLDKFDPKAITKKLNETVCNIQIATAGLDDKFTSFIDSIEALDVKELLKKLFTMPPDYKKAFDEIIAILLPLDKLKNFKNDLQKIPNIPTKMKKIMKTKIGELLAKIQEIQKKIKDKEQEFEDKLNDSELPQALDQYKETLGALLNATREDSREHFDLLKNKIAELSNGLVRLLSKIKGLKDFDFNEKFQNLQSKITTLSDNLQGKIPSDLTNLETQINSLTSMIDDFKNDVIDSGVLDNGKEIVKGIYQILLVSAEDLIDALGDPSFVTKIVPSLEGLLILINNLNLETLQASGLDSNLIEKYNKTIQTLVSILKVIPKMLGNANDILESNLPEDLKQQISDIKNNFDQFKESLSQLELDEKIKSRYNELINEFKPLYEQSKQFLENIPNEKTKLQAQLEQIKNNLGTQKNELKIFINDLKGKIIELMNNIIKQIEQAKNSDLANALKAHFAALASIKKSLDELFKDKSSYVKEKLYPALNKIKNFDGGAILEKIKGLDGLTDKSREKINDLLDIQSQIEKLKEKIKDNIKKKEEIMEGLKKIKENLDKIKPLDALKDNIDEIKTTIKNGTKPTIFDNIMDIREAINNFKKLIEEHNKNNLDININLNEKIDDVEAQLDKLKEKVEKSKLIEPIKEKIKGKINELKGVIDKQKNATKISDVYKKGKEYLDEGKKILGLIKEDIKENNFIKLNDIIEDLKKNFTEENAKEFIEDMKVCDYEFQEKAKLLDNIKSSNERMKNAFNNLKTKQYIDEKVEESKKELEKIKNNFQKFLDDDRFIIISGPIKILIKQVTDIQDKINESNLYKLNKKIVENNKKKLKELEDKIKDMSLKQLIYEIEQKVKDFDFKDKLKKFNETKNYMIDHWNKYIELENSLERIDTLFKGNKELLKKTLKKNNVEAKKLLPNIVEDEKKLKDLSDKIDELNENNIIKVDKNIINDLFEELIEKGKEIQEKIDNFPDDQQSKVYDEAIDDLSEHLKKVDLPFILKRTNKTINRQKENLVLIFDILNGISGQYKSGNFFEVTNNLTELINEEVEGFKNETKKLIGEEKLEKLKLDEPKLEEIKKKIEEDVNKFEEQLKDFIEKNKNLDDIKESLLEKLEEFNEKHLNKTSKERLEELKEAIKKVNDRIIQFINKEELEAMVGKIKKPEVKDLVNKLIENVKSVDEKIKNNSPIKDISDSLLKNLEVIDGLGIIKTLREIKNADIDAQKELENAKRLKELAEEMQDIYDSSPLMQIIGKLIIKTRVLEMKDKKQKVKKAVKNLKNLRKKIKNIRKLDSEAEMTCKIDQNIPMDTKLSIKKVEFETQILNYDNYELTFYEDAAFVVKTENCNSGRIAEIRSHLFYKSYNNCKIEKTKKRVTFNLFVRQKSEFTYPDFFYIIVKVKINIKIKVNTNAKVILEAEGEPNNIQTEVDSYCLLNALSVN